MTKSRGIGRGGARRNSGPKPRPPTALDFGIDPDSVDPRRILAAIAVSSTTPSGVRVNACRVLLEKRGRPEEAEQARQDDIGARAVQILGERAFN